MRCLILCRKMSRAKFQTIAHDRAGFSLIELMIAMAIGTIVLAAIMGVYTSHTRSYTTQNVAAEVQQTVRAGVDYMVEDIMMAGFDPLEVSGAAIRSAGSSRLSFTLDRNMNGTIDTVSDEEVTYRYDGISRVTHTIDESQGAGADTQPFIDNVSELTFTYRNELDQDMIDDLGLGDPLPADDLDDIRTVEIRMTVTEPAGRGSTVQRTYNTRVRCRNIGLN